MRKRVTKRVTKRATKRRKSKRRNTNRKRFFGGALNESTAIQLVTSDATNENENNRRIARLEAMMPFYKRGIQLLQIKEDELFLKKHTEVPLTENDKVLYERVAVRKYDRLSLFDNYFIELAKGDINIRNVNQIIAEYFRVAADFPGGYEPSVVRDYVGGIPGAVTRPGFYANNLVSPSATPVSGPLGGND